MNTGLKPLVWLSRDGITAPPFSDQAKREAGYLLWQLQCGEKLGMPASQYMPDIGQRCHELRVRDRNVTWRIVYHVGDEAVVILHIFKKKSRATPKPVISICQQRLKQYNKDRT